ncbi:hypothetical protein IH824_17445 [candidate division KSB1 bacterium]|nr:hypothetical protein [candidate division KSB1 bacterium]
MYFAKSITLSIHLKDQRDAGPMLGIYGTPPESTPFAVIPVARFWGVPE